MKEGAGKIDVLVRRHGNLNYAIVLCRTEAGTATDIVSTEPGLHDYVTHAGQVRELVIRVKLLSGVIKSVLPTLPTDSNRY